MCSSKIKWENSILPVEITTFKRGGSMLLEDAVALRIEQLCIERKMTKYALSERSGVPQTTLTSIKKKRSTSVKLKTLYAICEGFDISLEEFFACSLFDRNTLHD